MPGFVDEAQLHVKGGDGGAGAVAFRREAHVDKGGPDGGDGGQGGDVWLVADRNVASLYGFRDHPHRRAGNGTHGSGKGRHGRSGEDLVVGVPTGTVVRTLDGQVVADLSGEGDRWLAAAGGQGGKGNARFLSNRRRAPGFAEQGEVGVEAWFNLELKLMADVALVGFPNAGKSTLISRISAARPKIADYPFTTLQPNLGVVRYDDMEFVVADIPGLIEGASEGRGLGHQFLRHIERVRVLVVLVDLASAEGRSATEQQRILLDELGRYQPELLTRPRIIVGSRADLLGYPNESQVNERRANESCANQSWANTSTWEGPTVSSLTGDGLPALLGEMAMLVQRARAERPRPASFAVHRPEPAGIVVERDHSGDWIIRGRQAERAVALSTLTDTDALAFAQDRLRSLGVDRALARAGARDGDRVHIGTFEFDYSAD